MMSITCWRGCTSRRRSLSYCDQDGGVTGIVFARHEFRRLCGIAERHVEALRANGRHHMGRLADQEDAVLAKSRATRPLHREGSRRGPMSQMRPSSPWVLIWISARQLAGPAWPSVRQRAPGAPSRPGSSVAGHGHRGEGAGALVILGRDAIMRARVREARRHADLVIGSSHWSDACRIAQDRIPAIGCQHDLAA